MDIVIQIDEVVLGGGRWGEAAVAAALAPEAGAVLDSAALAAVGRAVAGAVASHEAPQPSSGHPHADVAARRR